MTTTIDRLESKPSDERETPQSLYDALDRTFHFAWDVAARAENAKVPAFADVWSTNGKIRVPCYLGPDHHFSDWRDALTIPWARTIGEALDCDPWGLVVWCNPPYSRNQLVRWYEKAKAEAEHGLTTVLLIPGDTSTEAFHTHVRQGEWYCRTGRAGHFNGAPLTAEGKKAPPFFPSHLFVVRPPLPAEWARPY